MALIKCENCGKEISNKANVCIHCGFPISKNNYIINEKGIVQNEKIKDLEKQLEYEKEKAIKEKEIIDIQNKHLKENLENKKNRFIQENQNLNSEKNRIAEEVKSLNNENENLRKELEVEKNRADNLNKKLNEKKKDKLNKVMNTSNNFSQKLLNIVVLYCKYLLFW